MNGPYHLGIDVGTTYTAAAVMGGAQLQVFELSARAAAIPTVVSVVDGEALVGEAAERRRTSRTVAREFKRRFGDPTPLLVGGVPYGAEALTAEVLRWVIRFVTAQRGEPPVGVVVTHPAVWGPHKMDLLVESTRQAGIEQAAFLSEPVAAAVFYDHLERIEPGRMVAVYDLGGGTCDVAVVRRGEAGFEIVGTPDGLERFGGIDLDVAVLGFVQDRLGGALDDLRPDDPTTVAALARLRAECTTAKEVLSVDTEVAIPVMLPNLHTEVRLTRAEFEDMIRPRLRDTVHVLSRSVRSAGIEYDDLDRILMVGGSSRIPLVVDAIRSETGRPIAVDAHPKHAVCEGAALRANELFGSAPTESTPQVLAAQPEPSPAGPPPQPGAARGPEGEVGQDAAPKPVKLRTWSRVRPSRRTAAIVGVTVAVVAAVALWGSGVFGGDTSTATTLVSSGTTVGGGSASTTSTTTASTLPVPSWAGEPVPAAEIETALFASWMGADNRAGCSALHLDDRVAVGGLGGVAWQSQAENGWGVIWDLPDRAWAYGVSGVGTPANVADPDLMPFQKRWSDGSQAGYGPDGPEYHAELVIPGEDCYFAVWSALSLEHLEHMLDSLRRVEGMGAGDPSWRLTPLAKEAVGPEIASAWSGAANRDSCSALYPDDLGLTDEAAVHETYFDGGWAVAWDLALHDGAIGVAGTGVTVAEATWLDLAESKVEWSDGSLSGYGPNGLNAAAGELLADLVIPGEDCLYQVWTDQGEAHLLYLLGRLRKVAGMESSTSAEATRTSATGAASTTPAGAPTTQGTSSTVATSTTAPPTTTTAPATVRVHVIGHGTGAGSVGGLGVSCDYAASGAGEICYADFAPGTTVTVAASPASSDRFAGWGAECGYSTASSCQVTLTDPDTNVWAQFEDTTTVQFQGFGDVTASIVLSGRPDVTCRHSGGTEISTMCQFDAEVGATIAVAVIEITGGTFDRWSNGVCVGQSEICSFTATGAFVSTRAVFAPG